jgi:hypothetical protein
LREPLDVPKYLLLAAAIPMHWVALFTPMPAKPIALVAILTIYHNLQYHRLIWFHNRKYCAQDARGPQAGKPAAPIRSRCIHQSPADLLHRVRNSFRPHLSRPRGNILAISICTPAIHLWRCRRRFNSA